MYYQVSLVILNQIWLLNKILSVWIAILYEKLCWVMEDTYYNIVVLWWGSIDSYGYLRKFWVMRNIPRENAWSNAALRTNYGLYKWNSSSDYVWISLSQYLCLLKTNYWCCKITLPQIALFSYDEKCEDMGHHAPM